MTPRQDGGFFAGLKMSQLGTSQDLWTQDFLRAQAAIRDEEKKVQKERDRARIFPWAATREEKIGRRIRGRARIFAREVTRNR